MSGTFDVDLRQKLSEVAPHLCGQVEILTHEWTSSIVARLDNKKSSNIGFPKTFNDPVWGVVELLPWETELLDSPLLQRLRGVRQLGMAHTVYPGAGHDRLEHTRGVVEAADRMIRALTRNAEHRRKFGRDKDEQTPLPSEFDVASTRLAALLHDVGHGPFSHATEELLRSRHVDEFQNAEQLLQQFFEGSSVIATSEILAVLIVLSVPMRKVLEHARFGVPTSSSFTKADLAPAIAARILGSRSYLDASYLSGVISGPLDADKLDYMARDSHHAGLPLGLDINRLISKLEVVTVTTNNAPKPELRNRAMNSPHERFYELGISLAGLGAYEQLVIGRVILYDRIYYHHKVRAAEAMVRRLVLLSEEERAETFSLQDMFCGLSDDSMLSVVSGQLTSPKMRSGAQRSLDMGLALQNRDIYYRAFAFASRFIAGLDNLPEQEQADTRAILWGDFVDVLSEPGANTVISEKIFDVAKRLHDCIPEFKEKTNGLLPEHILVDLPFNKVAAPGGDILTRTESGHVGTPNLFFDPQRWSRAYEQQKQCGFVFTPKRFVKVVALAARIVFFNDFQLMMNSLADRASKTTEDVKNIISQELLKQAMDANICSPAFASALSQEKSKLIQFKETDISLPEDWRTADPQLSSRLSRRSQFTRRFYISKNYDWITSGHLVQDMNQSLQEGLSANDHRSIRDALNNMISFQNMMEKNGAFVSVSTLSERELQNRLRDHLLSLSVNVREGSEMAGGETDLILPGEVLIENKKADSIPDPLDPRENYAWQARRYNMALCKRVSFVVLAYKPANENALPSLTKRIRIFSHGTGAESHVEIRVAIPWGHSVPSRAKAP